MAGRRWMAGKKLDRRQEPDAAPELDGEQE